MGKAKSSLQPPPGSIPLIDIAGDALECGQMLGWAWRDPLRAQGSPEWFNPAWWNRPPLRAYVSRHCADFPEFLKGVLRGAGIAPPKLKQPQPARRARERTGCTSFAIHGSVTRGGQPISGQSKDTPIDRCFRYRILRLRIKGGPAQLTMTYPGWLFGHGFVRGGCSVFRNALYAGDGTGELPYDAWGLLTLHAPSVDDAVALTRRLGVNLGFHCAVADEHGGIIGVESGRAGLAFVKPKRGLYTHANAVVGSRRLKACEQHEPLYSPNSLAREGRLRESFEHNRGRLTPQLAYAALMDHHGDPTGICRHHSAEGMTSAVVIAEPTRGTLTVTRGNPCSNWPQTFEV